MSKTLVIGFGNVYRRDDGVGFAVLNALRERLGRDPLDADDYGYDDLGDGLNGCGERAADCRLSDQAGGEAEHEIDMVFLHQLTPELAEVITRYAQVIFVDAHVGSVPDPIRVEEVATCYGSATVPHQLLPGTLLAMARDLYGRQPRGILVSIRGYDFDFGQELSPQTAALVPESVDRILASVLSA